MSEVYLDNSREVYWLEDGSFKVAAVLPGIPIIFLLPVPKESHSDIGDSIEEVLEHETIHLILDRIKESEASEKFDNIFPFILSLMDVEIG